jgi:hypothetical protein
MSYKHKPLGLYNNKILVWVSLYPFFSLSILVGLSLSPPTPFCYHCMLSFNLTHPFLSFSSTPTFLMAKDKICDANDHGHNNAMNPPPLD